MTLANPSSPITYDGATDVTHWAVATLKGVSGGLSPSGSLTIVYYIGSSATGPAITSSPVNAGTYTVVASYAGDANYTAAQSMAVTFSHQPGGDNGCPGRAACQHRRQWQQQRNELGHGHGDGGQWSPGADGRAWSTRTIGTFRSLSSSPTAAGTYTVVASYSGNSNYLASQSNPVSFTIQPVPGVSVTSFQVNDGNVQRSMIESLSVTFSSAVTLAAGAMTLTTQSGTVVPISYSLLAGTTATYVVTWTSDGFTGGSLANGNYVLTVNHLLVGNGSVMAANQTYSFYRLFGDFLGTGTVNAQDYTLFKKVYGRRGGFLDLRHVLVLRLLLRQLR